MASYDLPRAGAPGAGRGLSAIFTFARSLRDARRTRAALESLSDYELDDIGLTRADIARVSRSWF